MIKKKTPVLLLVSDPPDMGTNILMKKKLSPEGLLVIVMVGAAVEILEKYQPK